MKRILLLTLMTSLKKNIYVLEASAAATCGANNQSAWSNAAGGGDTSYIGAAIDNLVEDNCLACEADTLARADEESVTHE